MEPYQLFMDSLKRPYTKKIYKINFDGFLRHTKLTPKKIIKTDPKKLQDIIIKYVVYLRKEKKLAYGSAANILSSIQKFCVMNDLILNWKKIQQFLGEHERTIKDRVYTKQEIRDMLEVSDERKKAVILILVSTGIRVGAFQGLKLKHLLRMGELYRFIIYENTLSEYCTFCSPEAVKAIDFYIEKRKRDGETITAESPLVREDYDSSKVNPAHPITKENVSYLIYSVLKDIGLRKANPTKRRTDIMRMHAFRKGFNTSLMKAGVKPVVVEMLMGHKVGLQQNYLRMSEEEVMAEYVKALDLLTISEEKKLRHEVEKLKVETAELDIMKKNYIDMKLQLESKDDDIKNIYKALYEKGIIKKE